MDLQIAGIKVKSTRDIINKDTRFCGLIFGDTGSGKTTLAESMHRMTMKYMGKPTLLIAMETADGGGAMTLQKMDVPYLQPKSLEEHSKIVAAMSTDTQFGAVVDDSATEYVNTFLKPYALKFPSREKMLTREAGVPERSDYQTMGEKCRQDFMRLIALTTHPDPNIRKHLLVTALVKEKFSGDGKDLIAIQPDLPGAMSSTATAMFNTVAQLVVRIRTIKDATGKVHREAYRVLLTAADGVRIVKDRTGRFPAECEPDIEIMWEKYWLPALGG